MVSKPVPNTTFPAFDTSKVTEMSHLIPYFTALSSDKKESYMIYLVQEVEEKNELEVTHTSIEVETSQTQRKRPRSTQGLELQVQKVYIYLLRTNAPF